MTSYKQRLTMTREDALEIVKKMKDNASRSQIDAIGMLIPELKDSEDEIVRKELINIMNLSYDCGIAITKENRDRYVAWLEKQGKQTNLPQFTFDDVLALQCCMETVKKVQEDKELYERLQSLHDRLHDAYWIEKQDKPEWLDNCDIKTAPKFKVGDWIACEELDAARIININIDKYEVEFTDGAKAFPHIDYIDRNNHLWTIQDAKDGDVLVDVYGNIGIYEKCDDFDWMSYCSLGHNGGFQHFKIEHENEKTYPATKEQREFLFEEMAESGYEWDAENKELKF